VSSSRLDAQTYVVDDAAVGERLDRWLASLPGAPTRSQIAAAIGEGLVTVDDRPAKAGHKLRAGERVVLRPRSSDEATTVAAEEIALEVLYEDEHVVAINKPAGMVVHPAVGNRRGTLVNAILHAYPCAEWPGARERAGIVHRLDRDTSGVILVALSAVALEGIAKQFRERTVEKEYLALVRGRVAAAGTIDAAIGRHPRDRKRMSTAARKARSAQSHYEPLERFEETTLLLVRPRTGRTHQIRVHLATAGWPIVADPLYGGAGRPAKGRLMTRLALHAWRIRFDHPVSGARMTVTAPLADDFAAALDALRAGHSG
jgi:23S rRNA pseudouridine1911/1915/1917 synthase